MKLLIIVPVHHRPQNAEPFMQSLKETVTVDSDFDIVAVAAHGDEDTGQAWLWNGAAVIYGDLVSYPEKVQDTYDRYLVRDDCPEWNLLVGDDVKFHDGWYEAFLEAAKDPGAGLISTNDMGNPYVTSGTHATHPIISTKYVEERGACWSLGDEGGDGLGHIVYTGYRHSWVDEEWSVKAIHDGVFRYAPECKIEHLHPTWSKGVDDPTYAVARDHLMADHRIYVSRHDRAQLRGQA